MKRSLVLTSEGSRHPFRASLPSHISREIGAGNPRHARIAGRWFDAEDLRTFACCYLACLSAVSAFLI